MSAQYRYPGAQPFKTAQKDLFFGRDEDIVRLHRMVKTQALVVLHAKSGMGKSSLLNAGLVPEVLKEGDFEPVFVRFNAWTEGKEELPVDIAHHAVSPQGSQRSFLDSLISDEPTLWHELKEIQLLNKGKCQLMLLFDQFEELFTYPPAAVTAFKTQLAEAIYTKIPQRYREVLERQIAQRSCQLSESEFDQLEQAINLRVVLSIRSDRMHLMDRLSDALPDILAHCYELSPLTREQARDAITEPALSKGAFVSPPFAYTADAQEKILDFLDDAEGRIEAVQLQILCRNFEERASNEQIKRFDARNIGDLEKIISGFYHRQLAAITDPDELLAVRRLIEDGLIVPEDKQRLTLHEAQIMSLFKVPRHQLNHLVDGGLLRAETALRGGYAYELSHDTLVEPALIARRARKQEEENAALAEERRKRQRARNTAIAFGALALLSFGAALYAFRQTNLARAAEADAILQKEKAEAEKNRANENERLAELRKKEALTEKERAEFQTLVADSAKQEALSLAAKGIRLQQNISGSDTYQFLSKKGRTFLLEGDYRNALTHFATARFVQESGKKEEWVETATIGIQAERLFIAGRFDAARNLYREVLRMLNNDPAAHAQRRLAQMDEAEKICADKLAENQGKNSLSLNGRGLYALPENIGQIADLQTLDISGNYFFELPHPVFKLHKLKTLLLRDASVTTIAPEIAQLSDLEKLVLTNSALETLPLTIGQLGQLRTLALDYTPLSALPETIGKLGNLRELTLSETPLHHLPASFSKLSHLEQLSLSAMRDGSFNFGSAFRLLANLPKLQSLDLSGNNLSQLPPEIGLLKNLKRLNLSGNDFDEAGKKAVKEMLEGCAVEW